MLSNRGAPDPKKPTEKRPFPVPRSIDPCLCESQQAAGRCCLQENGVHLKKPRSTKPPGGRTGRVTSGCYAALLEDCDGGSLTREHYVSEAILELMGDRIAFHGAPWNTDNRPLPPAALASRVLCARHNTALSVLDSEAARLFRAMDGLRTKSTRGRFLFCGEDIERWMFKTLAGIVASGSVTRGGERGSGTPSRDYLEILYDEKPMPLDWGLHFFDYLPGEERPASQIRIHPEVRPDHGRIIGVTIALVGFQLRLNMGKITNLTERRVIHRPRALILENEAYLEFSWQDASRNVEVHFARGTST